MIVGIAAHVDSGKTTLSEQILFRAGALRKAGRVDHQDSFLDSHQIERARGITVFSGQASFTVQGQEFTLIDTPGHVDFSGETERAMKVMDLAVLVISGVEGIEGHTETLWKLLRKNHVPTMLFINKMDRAGADDRGVLDSVRMRWRAAAAMPETSGDGPGDETKELLAEQSEELMEMFLEEKGDGAFWQKQAVRAFWEGRFIPAASGSALEGTGVGQLLELLYEYGAAGREKRTEEEKFSARVWKIRQEDRGERLTFLKILSGTLRVKDTVKTGEEEEKVNQIRFYSGEQYRTAEKAEAGSLCAVTGLRGTAAGQGLGMGAEDEGFEIHPVLQVKAVFREEEISSREMLRILRIIQEEDPTLQVVWQEETADIQIQMMGRIQLEVLQQIAEERFGVSLEFGKPEPVYAETIDSAVTGFGHFEPLRHYSEVALRIEPGERGSGIVFESRCHVDLLPIQYQKLIGTHVLERPIRGILTGSRVTDLKVTLLAGLHHIKHTEGGDFREAVYRALRQGLEKAENRLLEPYYRYEIRMPESCLGKVMADLGMLGVQMDPPAQSEGEAFLSGRGPAVFFMDYPVRLAAMTEGKGVVSLRPGGYDLCHNPEEVIAEKGYEKGADKEYPSSSVFCAKGTSFVVQWNEAESYMHTIKKGLVTEY